MQKLVKPEVKAEHLHNPNGRKWTSAGLKRHLEKSHPEGWNSFYSYANMSLDELRAYHNDLHGGTQFRETSPNRLSSRAKKYPLQFASFTAAVFVLGVTLGVIWGRWL